MLLFRFFRLVYTIFFDWKAPSKKSETQGPGFRSLRYVVDKCLKNRKFSVRMANFNFRASEYRAKLA